MRVYKNNELLEYINDTFELDENWKERDFVEYTRKYFSKKNEKILAIGGLRGTGKTTGLLQAIKALDACYIVAQKGEAYKGDNYVRLLSEIEQKYIVIDEYSWILERDELDKYLFTLVQNGKRVVITGTESISLDFLNYGNLIHRVDMVHVNLFSYEEYCRIYNKEQNKETCEEYLIKGGVFKEYAITNYETMRNYIKTAIIDNLVGYMGNRMSVEKATALVYAVLYKAVCPSNLKNIPTLIKNRVTVESFLDEMGVDDQITFSEKELKNVADILEQIEVIVKVDNYDSKNPLESQYYIVNPSLTCQLILSAYDTEISNEILGHVFEATVVCHLYNNKLTDHKIYFLNSEFEEGVNKELDIVITSEKEDYVYLFECKYRAKDTLAKNATILSPLIEERFPDSIIEARYVVYNGDVSYKTYGAHEIIFTPINDRLDKYYIRSKPLLP